ncbi:hypothetical protein PInf_017601 [Phytophthora infestans]|nr:hypothetical protein PInf_017601 [Phytophthora infestans]
MASQTHKNLMKPSVNLEQLLTSVYWQRESVSALRGLGESCKPSTTSFTFGCEMRVLSVMDWRAQSSSIPVSELRVCRPVPFRMVNPLNCMSSPQDLVQKRFSLVSSYRKQEDGDLQLCFDDQTLEDEETFSAYLSGRNDKPEHNRPTNHRQPSWPKPFAGILWVLPWRPSRKHPLQWGDGDNSKARQEAHTGND